MRSAPDIAGSAIAWLDVRGPSECRRPTTSSSAATVRSERVARNPKSVPDAAATQLTVMNDALTSPRVRVRRIRSVSRYRWSGDTLVVGAPREASAATGINGDQTNNNASNAGAVYLFR
jgi:hypothetical protein